MLKKEQNRIWTVPNILSFIRILLIAPTAVLLWQDKVIQTALLAFVGGLMDVADGIIARKFDQKSELGKILDPMADKLFIGVLVVVLFLQNKIPLWFIIAVLSRDFLILLGGAIISTKIKIVPPSNFLGKITALILGITLLFIILNFYYISTILMYLSVILIVSSFINYLLSVLRQIQEVKNVNK